MASTPGDGSRIACMTCTHEADPAPAPWMCLARDAHWRLAHAFGVAVPGWLVLVPRRHVERIADLTAAEAASLGTWQARASRALQVVTGCEKTYVAQFAEAEGFRHVHFHIVPRAADLAVELRGPRVFGLMGSEGALDVAEMNRMAALIGERMAADPR